VSLRATFVLFMENARVALFPHASPDQLRCVTGRRQRTKIVEMLNVINGSYGAPRISGRGR
jgi:hypothetical protein